MLILYNYWNIIPNSPYSDSFQLIAGIIKFADISFFNLDASIFRWFFFLGYPVPAANQQQV